MKFQLSYWDGAILSAAQRLNAHTIFTEDLNASQSYNGITAINPFI